MPSLRCIVFVASPRPRIVRGKYEPECCTGTYGFRGKDFFGIPEEVKPFKISETIGKKELAKFSDLKTNPIFVVDPQTCLALPIGKSVVNDPKLPEKLRVATQGKYVKAMVLKVRDLVEILIIGAAGAGVALYTLHLIGVFTGNAVTI